jgi:hypothetical protein
MEDGRVSVAAMFLAGRDLGTLQQVVDSARNDRREVLGAAEYHRYHRLTEGASRERQQRAIEKGWRDYVAWFRRA